MKTDNVDDNDTDNNDERTNEKRKEKQANQKHITIKLVDARTHTHTFTSVIAHRFWFN